MASFKKSSAKSLNDLPLELLLEILYKLSVKELHRNKTVCKLWSSIISHPSFRSQYLTNFPLRNSSPCALTLYLTSDFHCSYSIKEEWLPQSPKVSLNFLHRATTMKTNLQKLFYRFLLVVASSNGLLLCTNTYMTCLWVVCNPLTKQWLTLPPPPSRHGKLVLSGFVCYESENGSTQFKVVRIVRNARFTVSKVLDMEIFDSAANQWRVLKKTLDIKISFWRGDVKSGIEHKGILYWENISRSSIIAFDPNHDTCHLFSLPEPSKFNRVLGKSRDHLYYAHINFLAPNKPCTIWRCDEFQGEHTWTVHHWSDLDLNWIDQQNLLPGRGCQLSAIDPMDCNILYLSCHYQYSNSSWVHRIYSLDVSRGGGEGMMLCSFPVNYFPENLYTGSRQSIMFVEPTWPTSLPKLPNPVLHQRKQRQRMTGIVYKYASRHIVIAFNLIFFCLFFLYLV